MALSAGRGRRRRSCRLCPSNPPRGTYNRRMLPDERPLETNPATPNTANEIPLARPVAFATGAPEARPVIRLPGQAPGWSALQAGLALLTFFATDLVVGIVHVSRSPNSEVTEGMLLFDVGLKCAAILLVMYALLRLRGEKIASLGLVVPQPLRDLVAGFAAAALCFMGNIVIFFVYMVIRGSGVEQTAEEKLQGLDVVGNLSFAAIVPVSLLVGFYEEVLFRGMIFSRLTRLFSPRDGRGAVRVALAALVSSLVFGLLHAYQGPIGVAQTTLLGLLLCGAARYCRSLWPCIVAHAGVDMLGITIVKLSAGLLPAVTSAPTQPAS